MSEKIQYLCEACKYSATVFGGPSEDFISFLETRLCLDCKSIVDVPIEFKATAYIGGDADFKIQRIENQCPECFSTNVQPWDEEHSCPKCGTAMDTK